MKLLLLLFLWFPAPQVDQATVIVYMPHHSTTTWRFSGKFYVDEKKTAEISKNRYFIVHLKPGTHSFFVRDKKLGGLNTALVAGETYYLRINVDEGGLRVKFRGVSEVPKDEGSFAIKQMQPIKKGDVYDPTVVDMSNVSP
jgi:hypothetical protein